MSIKGYESTPMSEANAPNYPGDDHYQAPGSKAVATKARWKQNPAPAADPPDTEDGED